MFGFSCDGMVRLYSDFHNVAQGFSPAEAAALKGCATIEKKKPL
jgi:hypothetical protein